MKYFEELQEDILARYGKIRFFKQDPRSGGFSAVVDFKDGYALSIIRTMLSYGGEDGLFEAAVLKDDDKVDYDHPIHASGDVLGYLEVDEVYDIVKTLSRVHNNRHLPER